MRSTRMHSCGTRSGMRVQRLSSCSFSSWFSQGCSTVSEIRRCITSEHRPRASFAYPRVGCVVFCCAPDDVPVAICDRGKPDDTVRFQRVRCLAVLASCVQLVCGCVREVL